MTAATAAGFSFEGRQLPFDLQRGRRDGQSPERGAAMFSGHHGRDVLRRVNDFIERDQRIKIGQRHVGTGKGVTGRHDVLSEAWCLDAIRDGITNEAEHALKGHRGCGDGLIAGPTRERHECRRRHAGR